MTDNQPNNLESLSQPLQNPTELIQSNKDHEQPIIIEEEKPVNSSEPEAQDPKIHAPEKEPITINIISDKLNDATASKNKGNNFFKQRNYVAAIEEYSIALRTLDPNYFYTATEEERVKMAELSSSLLYNLGFCYFNSHDMMRAELFLSEAIIINSKYTKALHKRALARYELGKYEESFEDIKLAFSQDKSSAEIHASYSKILSKYNEQAKHTKEKMKELSSKIFNSSQKEIQENKKNESKNTKWSWSLAAGFLTATAIIGVAIVKAISKK